MSERKHLAAAIHSLRLCAFFGNLKNGTFHVMHCNWMQYSRYSGRYSVKAVAMNMITFPLT